MGTIREGSELVPHTKELVGGLDIGTDFLFDSETSEPLTDSENSEYLLNSED
jgi:hypothetical protein